MNEEKKKIRDFVVRISVIAKSVITNVMEKEEKKDNSY